MRRVGYADLMVLCIGGIRLREMVGGGTFAGRAA